MRGCFGLKVAWVHSFPPVKHSHEASGCFVHELASSVNTGDCSVTEFYTGKIGLGLLLNITMNQLHEKVSGCNIVHSQYGSGCALVSSRLDGPKVLTLRGSDWYCNVPNAPLSLRLHLKAANFLTRYAISRYQAVIVMSKHMAREVKTKTGHSNVLTIPDGVNMEVFKPADRLQARRSLGANDDDSPWILFSCQRKINHVKRFWLAEQAMCIVRKFYPNAKQRFMQGIPHEQVVDYVNASNLIVLTSVHEGWPNIIKEGLACNIPFVSTDVGDLSDIAEQDNYCKVVPPTPKAIGDAILEILRYSGTHNLRKHVSFMEMNLTAEKIRSVYRDLDF